MIRQGILAVEESAGSLEGFISDTKGFLGDLQNTGRPLSIDEGAGAYFNQMRDIAIVAIGNEALPQSLPYAVGNAARVVMDYGKIPNFNALFDRLGITSTQPTNVDGGILTTYSNGNRKRIFMAYFDPEQKAYSVLVNINTLASVLFPELFEKEISVNEGIKQVPGYGKLIGAIYGDSNLRHEATRTSFSENPLTFFNREDIRAVANDVGVDMPAFDAYILQNLPRANLLGAITTGLRFAAEYELVGAHPDFSEQSKLAYRVAAFFDALAAPFNQSGSAKYRVGIGLGERLWGNTAAINELTQRPQDAPFIFGRYF